MPKNCHEGTTKTASVWSMVAAVEMGLVPESAAKEFANPLEDSRQEPAETTNQHHPAARSSDHEKDMRTKFHMWPFIYEVLETQTSTSPVHQTKSVSKGSSRRQEREPKKEETTAPKIAACRKTDNATDLSIEGIRSYRWQFEGSPGVSSDSPRPSRRDLTSTRPRGRSLDSQDESTDGSVSESRRSIGKSEIVRSQCATTWSASEKIQRMDYSTGFDYRTFHPAKQRRRRNRSDLLDHSEYLMSVPRKSGNTWGNETSSYDEGVARSVRSADFAKRDSRVINKTTKTRKARKQTRSKNDTERELSRKKKKKNQLGNRTNHLDIPVKKKGLSKNGPRYSVTHNNHNAAPRISREWKNLLKSELDSKRNSTIDAPRVTAKDIERKHYSTRRRSYDYAKMACVFKRKSGSTSIAIMRDIQAHISGTQTAKDAKNIQDAISEIPADNLTEKLSETQKEDFDRDTAIEYDWERDMPNNEDNSFESSEQLPANAESEAKSTRVNMYFNRRKEIRKLSIDSKIVDKTETTYQGVFHQCVASSMLTSPLKINMDENRRLEDADVEMIHSSWPPRSSLTEGCGNEFDGALPSARKIVSDDFESSEKCCDNERTRASTRYKYREMPDTFATGTEILVRSDDAEEDEKFVNPCDATKNAVERKAKSRRSNELSLLTSSFCWDKNHYAWVPTIETKNTSNRKTRTKLYLIQSNADDKGNDSECDNAEDEERAARRMTRALIKTKTKDDYDIGRLVWGRCSGWWPALIIDAEHAGTLPESGKLWVYWIGESQISLLNKKTQIEPFSSKLEQRLVQKSSKNGQSQAIHETIQILRQHYNYTLTMPYYYWIKRNISRLEELDDLNFYPYPSKIQNKLDELKEKNAKITKQHLLRQRNSPEPKKQIVEKPKITNAFKQMEEERLPLQEQNPGVIAWAKITGHNWWPAMIIDYRDCCFKEPNFGCQWIMWYGDYTVSQVHHLAFLKFHKGLEKLHDYIQNTKKHVYLVGVLQAAKDYCSRLGCNTDNWTLASVFKYFSDMNNMHVPYNNLQVSESNKIYDKYSDEIVKKINELNAKPKVDDKRKNDIKTSDDLRSVMSGESAVEKLCLKCLKFSENKMEEHPFFIGSLCKECSNLFKPCMFVFGNDKKCFYCTVCADTGTVIICDNEECPRVYCTACLKFLIYPKTYDEMLREDPWECPLCKDESRLPANGILRPQLNWKKKLIGMFRTTSNVSTFNNSVVTNNKNKRSVRVLSLFDGLSTGLLVLSKLGIDVEVYYASEIDKDALMVSNTHYGDRIIHLGDVRGITTQKIKEIAPIDLLIGGSPCNDLSLVNPARLGLHDPRGTGVLFFEYCRIMKQLKRVNKGRYLYWLFENVASMPTEYRLEMNKHLGQEPDVVDSADFSPQHRLRLYWHNIPFNPYQPLFQKKQDVQDILTPNCNRYALVKKISTVTTNRNSLRHGKLEQKPIMMKGESDTLWITELEEIFGFPRHYTDVKNLSASNRQKLIGKSWSVQTLAAILQPLCSLFKCNTDKTS